MPFEVGISSGIMGAARPEEASQYVGLARKAYYGITQGVKFVQIDLESISELEHEGLEEEIKKVKDFGIKFGIHSETRAFGVEAAELDSAIEDDYKFGHERLGKILEKSGEIGSEYVLIHSSESTPIRFLGRSLQPAILVDFFGNPLNEFIETHKSLKEWLMGNKSPEEIVRVLMEIVNIVENEKQDIEEITRDDVIKVFEERGIKIPNYIWRELLPRGSDLAGYFAEMIKTEVRRTIGILLPREITRVSYKELPNEAKESVKRSLEDNLKRSVPEILKYFLDFVRSRSLSYGPERFAYWVVAKYLEVEDPEWWNKFVRASIEYFAKADGKSVEEWCRENKISLDKLTIDDDSFRELERLWVPAVSAKYIWGHFWQEKNWKKDENGNPVITVKPDLKKILRNYKIPLIFESPMAQRGVEEWLRLPNPLHFYYLCKEIGEDITGIALDFEHMMSLRLKPEVVIELFPEDGGKLVKVIHAGWPSPLAPTHLPLLLGSDEQLKYYKWFFALRKKGFGVKDICFLIYERGSAHVRESIITLRKIAEYLEKNVEPEKLPKEFFGIELFASPERQREIIRAHAFEPLKGLLAVPEEEWTFLGRAARERGKVEEWKKEELK